MKLCFVGDWMPAIPLGVGVADSLIVGNLECAFCDGIPDSAKAYTSVLPKDSIPNIGHSGFSALSVANNHVYDANNLEEMMGVLRSRFPQIQFFGSIENPFAKFVSEGRSIYVIGSLEPCRSRGKAIYPQEKVKSLIEKIKTEDSTATVYVYPHWGKEGEYTRWPSPAQQVLARSWIDAGADGVFGSHSHVFQGKEIYKGKQIYYSLGNYFFPHPESKLYEGTHDGLTVEIADGEMTEHYHHFEDDGAFSDSKFGSKTMEEISRPLSSWSTWKWAKTVGAFNLKKNSSSWQIRLRKNFIKTLPKFLVWQLLPKTLLFRIAALCR